ncbi:MAG: T9SS type A sorting domain-containing protein [Chitinophagaceae bacterium]|nr:T9SS type A sorting domain-containing protein [Chitinophagaceae bacterium]
MQRKLLILCLLSAFSIVIYGQATRLDNNRSFDWAVPITSNILILHSGASNTLFSYNISANLFTELSTTVTVQATYDYGVLNGKLYFAGNTGAEGIELWTTDGTIVGTTIVKNINAAASSEPTHGFIVYNNELYFTADDGLTGRELWKTNGTDPGTVQVKDIKTPGATNAFLVAGTYVFGVINNRLVFSTSTSGNELWATEGSDPNTVLLSTYSLPFAGSAISEFTEYGTDLIYTAFDPVLSQAIYKTNGTVGGTSLVADIDPTPPTPPFYFPNIIGGFYLFQNELYFAGSNGASANGFELWKTNGTMAGTSLVKDINVGIGDGAPLVILGVTKGNKFYFPATTADGRELWESDGTTAGTVMTKDIAPGVDDAEVLTLPSFVGTGLFQGDKFFLIATTPGEGREYYISDGTAAGTVLLKDIGPTTADGADENNLGFIYTTSQFFFIADNGVNGAEPWRSDGTLAGTVLVQDINTNPISDGSEIAFATIASNRLFFFGTDGDSPTLTDFFVVDGDFIALPLRWVSVDASPDNANVIVSWKTASEEQTDHFLVQRSNNGSDYANVGHVNANGALANSYVFTDVEAMKLAGTRKLYYRVQYVDKDGKTDLSRVVTVDLNSQQLLLRVQPNPVHSEVKLVLDARSNDKGLVRVMNMEGKLIWQQPITLRAGQNIIAADFGHLPNGNYLVHVSAGGSVIVQKILIQR